MNKKSSQKVSAETIDDEVTDVELEIPSVDAPQPLELTSPYDPTLIRVDTKNFSLRNILDMIEEDEIDLAPDFQRLRVWKSWQKSRLIESILLRIPLPAFYFASDEDGRLQVVDGVQRLTTIHDFVRGGVNRNSYFDLSDLEYLDQQVGGKSYEDIEGTSWGKRILSTQISVNVIDPQTPGAVKFEIFKRINTGGTPLSSQEIRHCMSGKRSRNVLKVLAESEEFNRATGGKLFGHIRMADREMVLRVLAFRLLGDIEGYSGALDELLNWATHSIDQELTTDEIQTHCDAFVQSMTTARNLFGRHAFRKWPMNYDGLYPINKALFEVWGVLLSEWAWDDLAPGKSKIITGFRNLFEDDPFFVASISTSTGDPKRVLYRFGKIRELVEEAIA